MSIDSLYEGAIAELTAAGRIQTLSQHLLSLNNNDDRVKYVYSVLEDLEAFPTVLTEEKNETVSTFYRNLGNKCFQKSDDYKAWQYYNLSLLYAPVQSEHYSLALSNRSAVLYSLNKFKECLNDIENVFSKKYPDKIRDKLIKRKSLCEEKLLERDNLKKYSNLESNEYLQFQKPQSPRFSCASEKLEVVISKEMGRHVVAKTDIKVGEVLVQENPYFNLLLTSQLLFSCSYCLSRSANLLPCHDCCFALYCSELCKEKASREYHRTECSLMATLIEMKFTKLELLALRTVIKARNDHCDWSALFKTVQEAESKLDSEYRGHVKVNDEWVYDSKYYASIHTLESNVDKRHISDVFQKCVSAAVFLWLLEKTDFFSNGNKEEELKIRKCVGGMLLLHIMTSPTNMHGISTSTANADGDYVEELSLASAPYAFLSLINHSCAPNVVRFSKLGTGQISLFALRPIKKGMQVFDNYGAHHAIQDRRERQESLKNQYKFTCLCEACVNDWPLYLLLGKAKNLDVSTRKKIEHFLNSDVLENLRKGDMDTAKRIYKPLCELAENLEPFAPCRELAECQESLKQCLQIFQGLLPHGFSNIVEWCSKSPVK